MPPSSTAGALAEVTGNVSPPDIVIAHNPALGGAAWDAHLNALVALTTRFEIADAIRAGTWRRDAAKGTDILYFYCHGRRLARTGSSSFRPALELAPDVQITPQDVMNWPRLRPRIRWTTRRPLVVLNACSSGETLPDTLTDFVTAFISATGAAGVIATEVAMEAGLACRAMDLFFAGLWAGRSVCESLRSMRWQLLADGNVMGLAYTPYCDAHLHIPTARSTA